MEIPKLSSREELLNRLIEEVKTIVPDLIVDDEVTYLKASSGLLRVGKDEEGVYITGFEGEELTKQAKQAVNELKTIFPEENFRLG